MRNLILKMAAVCVSGLCVSAIAQTNINETPDDSGGQPMQGMEETSPAPDMSAGQTDQTDETQVQPAETATPSPVQYQPPAGNRNNRRRTGTRRTAQVGKPYATAVSTNVTSAFMPPAQAAGTNADELRLNFQNVPLDMVLNYLSDAAGFIIIMDTQVRGNVSVISSHPMTRDQAVDLLNSVLNQNGYAAIRNGQTLTIMDKNDAKTRNIPVKIGNEPNAIPDNDEIVTQIIPVRYIEAGQLVTDLSSFVSPQATIVANQAANSIVVTDTQANIRHLVEIIRAIDNSAQGETEIHVFHLQYANPEDVANELGQIFQNNNNSGQTQLPFRFGGGGGRGGFRGGPGGFFAQFAAANGQNNQNAQMQKATQVVAVADPRTQSVIVTATSDLMDQIAGMMEQLDVPSTRDQKVYTYHLTYGDPQQVLQVLQSTFPSSSTGGGGASSSSQTENSALIQRANQNATTVGNTSSTISSGLGNGTGSGAGRGGGSNLP